MARKNKKIESDAIIPDDLAAQLATYRGGAQRMLAHAANCSLETQADVDKADNFLNLVHRTLKELNEWKIQLLAPFEAPLNARINAIATIQECLESCKSTLKSRLLERNLQARSAQLIAIQEGNHAIAHAAPVESEAVREVVEWDFEIVDESLLPREVLRPDEKLIRQLAKKHGADAKCPGVRFFQRTRGVMR